MEERKLWVLKKEYDSGDVREIAFFGDIDAVQAALERIREQYMNFYLNTDERIEAWNTRPHANYVPEYDEETGQRVYNRGQWIEDKLCTLEYELGSYYYEEYDLITNADNFRFEDPFWYQQDDDKEEARYKLFHERFRAGVRKRKEYEKTREGKPVGFFT